MVSAALRATLIAVLVAAVPPGAKLAAQDNLAPSIHRLVNFGDSLSDPGNTYIETGEFEVRPFAPTPDAPYRVGRFHFTNGPTWAEQLATDLHLPRNGKPALRRPGIFTNYAFGLARAGLGGPFDLGGQVERFLEHFDGVAASETLYVLWIGSNDLRDAFQALLVDSTGATTQQIIAAAIGATASAIQDLHDAGARSFLVLNLPNIANTPALMALAQQFPDLPVLALGRQLTETYNGALENALLGLEQANPEIVIVPFDVFGGFEQLVENPELAGLTNVTDSCIIPGVVIGAICRRSDRYLFWDFIHPTERAHEYLAEQVQADLEMEFVIGPPPAF